MRPIAAPRDLGKPGRGLWRAIARQWADDSLAPDARELRLLADGCHEADMLAVLEAELQARIGAGELIVKGSMGQPVVTDLVAECRRSRAQVAALLRPLGFQDMAGAALPGRKLSAAEAGRLGGFAKHYGRGSAYGAGGA